MSLRTGSVVVVLDSLGREPTLGIVVSELFPEDATLAAERWFRIAVADGEVRVVPSWEVVPVGEGE